MINSQAHPYRLLFLTPDDSPEWFVGFPAQLSQTQYHCVVVATLDEAQKALQSRKMDAVIAANETSSLSLSKSLEDNGSYRMVASLKVLLTNNGKAVHEDLEQRFDAVLPSVGANIDHTLRSFLRMNGELNLIKNAIIYNVSHELRTPMVQVKAAIAMLGEALEPATDESQKETDEEQAKRLIVLAKTSAGRLEAAVTNITQLAGSLEINLEPIVVQDSVSYAMRSLKRAWQQHDHMERVCLDIGKELPPVLGDKKGLGTVLQQLVDNALKFSEEEVTIRAVHENGCVRISVADKGIGIPKEQLETIFDPFVQGDASPTRTHAGMGVGLAIAKLILDRHNTKIVVDSEKDKGSTFSFTLPVTQLE